MESTNNNNNDELGDLESSKTEERQKMIELIRKAREQFMAIVEQNPELYDKGDIKLAREDDWQVERFLLRKNLDVKQAVKMADETLRWRHQLRMPQWTDQTFSIEYWRIGGIFLYEPDREGNPVLYMRSRFHRRIPEVDKYERYFILYMVNKADQLTKGRGFTVVLDCKGAGYVNFDMDMIRFFIDALERYYPGGLQHFLVYEMPWIFAQTWKLILSMVPNEFRDRLQFVNKKSIVDYIDRANLPLYMGGECRRNFHRVPEGCRSAESFGHDFGLSERQIRYIEKTYRPFLDEAEEEAKLLEQD